VSSASPAQENSSVYIKKIAIDPGHGGRDPGTISKDGRYKEKDITLSVALKLGKLIENGYPGTEVIYTRKTDKAVPLARRTEIANKSKADLFISIHVNGVASRHATGSETFVMGADKTNSNFEVTRLENSVILLEGDDYREKYQGFDPNDPESYIIFTLLQNAHREQSLTMASLIQEQFARGPIKRNRGIKQAPFLVLWRTSMPSVLVELGFISNSNDLRVLSSNKQQETLARLIFDAVGKYKKQYEKEYSNGEPSATTPKEDTHYRVQILSLTKVIPLSSADFKGEKNISYITQGSSVKYTIGRYNSLEQARKAQNTIRKKFPQAFVIKVRNGKVVPL
jgi:N-acetylmuramoyl-L-alanine amidase